MTGASPCTIIITMADRDEHLLNLLSGLNKSTSFPDEIIIVCIEETIDLPEVFHFHIKTLLFPIRSTPFPHTKARNLGASVAKNDHLIFLDADCIPEPAFIEKMTGYVRDNDGLMMAFPRFLDGPSRFEDSERTLIKNSHTVRKYPAPDGGVEKQEDYSMFLNMAFAISKKNFDKIGGFNQKFNGYGPHGVDFAYRAREADIPLYATGATIFHQPHREHPPALQHFEEVVDNCCRFYENWNEWPMQSSLSELKSLGLIKWEPDSDKAIEIIKTPPSSLVEETRKKRNFIVK